MRWALDGFTQSTPAESRHCGIGSTDSGTKLSWLSKRRPNEKHPKRLGPEKATEDAAGRSTGFPKHEENVQMMNRSLNCIMIAVLAVTGVAAISAQELTQAEKEHALQYLESTKREVLDATKGLSEAQWNFKPAPDRWSVAQVMEHIAAAEDFIRVDFVQKKVMILP